MLKKPDNKDQISFFTNFFACNRQLDPNNRWVILSKLVPWARIEEKYMKLFSDVGAPGKAIRIAVGALIIKERLGLTDDETREQIIENPYLQYFLGYDQYTTQPPFDQSSLTRFRKRFTAEIMNDINEMICQCGADKPLDKKDDKDPPGSSNTGGGTDDAQPRPARIVSIHQPHVRPIVRGKANAAVEFGAKISISVVDGMTYLETVSFNNYAESKYLEQSVMAYKKRFGCFPETILVDQIYRNRDNRGFCKMHGIRINGPRLGRPPVDSSPEEKMGNRIDEGMRNQVEGKFGEAKRRFGLQRLLTRLPETSECLIAVNCIVMNLEQLLRNFFYPFFNVRISIHFICVV